MLTLRFWISEALVVVSRILLHPFFSKISILHNRSDWNKTTMAVYLCCSYSLLFKAVWLLSASNQRSNHWNVLTLAWNADSITLSQSIQEYSSIFQFLPQHQASSESEHHYPSWFTCSTISGPSPWYLTNRWYIYYFIFFVLQSLLPCFKIERGIRWFKNLK